MEGEPAGIPVGADTGYQLTADLIERDWTPHTRGVLVASPSNPTGTSCRATRWRRSRHVVRALGGQLIVDEIYLGLTYDGDP